MKVIIDTTVLIYAVGTEHELWEPGLIAAPGDHYDRVLGSRGLPRAASSPLIVAA